MAERGGGVRRRVEEVWVCLRNATTHQSSPAVDMSQVLGTLDEDDIF
jgi:hypothetical protein